MTDTTVHEHPAAAEVAAPSTPATPSMPAPPAKRGVRHFLRDTPLRVRLVIAAGLAVGLALGGVLTTGLYEVRHELRTNVEAELKTAADGQRLLSTVDVFDRTQSLVPASTQPGQIAAYVQLINGAGDSAPAQDSPALPVNAQDRAIASSTAPLISWT